MNVTSVINAAVSYPPESLQNESGESLNYADIIAQFYQAEAYKSRDEINAEDTELAKFREDLTTKGSALFLKELNEEKIEALIEEYRQKLMKLKEENPQTPMDINQMVSDFRKQLLEELMKAEKAEQENRPLQTDAMMSADILENVKTNRDQDKKSALADIGFLEQMLNPSYSEDKKKDILN